MLTTLSIIICVVKAFDPSVRPRCLITGQATAGWNQINSPQFPKPIPGKLECLYILTAPKGAKIELHFDQFELLANKNPSCKRQGLALLDPYQTNVPGQTEIFCGLQKPVPYVSRGNKVFLKFESNLKQDLPLEGFLIKYRIRAKKSAAQKLTGPQKPAQKPEGPKSASGEQSNPAQLNPSQRNAPQKQRPAAGSKPGPKPVLPKRSGGKIMAFGGGGAPDRPQLKSTKNSAAKNSAGRRPSNDTEELTQSDNTELSAASSDTNSTLADSTEVRQPQRANFYNDMPVAEKQRTRQLGSKSDLDTKRMLKYLLIGLGACAGAIVVFLVFRRVTGKDSGGLPEPEAKLPEGTLPTHMRAIMEHKEKMKSLGKNYSEES